MRKVFTVDVGDMTIEQIRNSLNTHLENYSKEVDKVDIESELATILQEEIWREITAETGETKQDLDNEIIAELIKLKANK